MPKRDVFAGGLIGFSVGCVLTLGTVALFPPAPPIAVRLAEHGTVEPKPAPQFPLTVAPSSAIISTTEMGYMLARIEPAQWQELMKACKR